MSEKTLREWRGPWKCKSCDRVFEYYISEHMRGLARCFTNGKVSTLVPYERRTHHPEESGLREALVRLANAAEPFLALPPDDMRDSYPYGQPTVAGECRKLNKAWAGACAALAIEGKEERHE